MMGWKFAADFLGGESDYVPADGREVAGLKWASHVTPPGGRVVFPQVPHLGTRPTHPNIVVYAACWVTLDADQEFQIRAGVDDGFYLWVGREPVIKEDKHLACIPDKHIVAMKLSKGRHRILIKVENMTGFHQFMMRLTTPRGEKLPGMRVGLTP